ncbi:MAG TPA: lysozyme inhibitor LprI family protein [Acidobacteriaceae bacterium]|nr:lysozyme inhibitor LprI family protein [Acidobacteriaceae bacterium]
MVLAASMLISFRVIAAQTTAKPNCDSSTLSMTELTHCSDDRLAQLEVQLEREYRAVLVSAADDPKLVQAIKNSQNAWIVYRSKLVSVAFPASGPHAESGSALIVEKNDFIYDLTREQIEHLRELKHIYTGR